MLILLIGIAAGESLYLFWRRLELRVALLWVAVTLGAFVVLCTETLSFAHALTRTAVGAAWTVLVLLLAIGCLLVRRPPGVTRDALARTLERVFRRPRLEHVLFVGIVIMAVLLLVTAVVSPPNTLDALDYHLPRMVMWIQNRTVDLFPTADFARLISPPWAEYAMLHLDLLYGGDRLVNLVEWSSAIGSAIAVSLVAAELGAGLRGQVFSALVAITIPQGALEASSAMNGYAVTFWMASTVVFVLRAGRTHSPGDAVGAGLAMGLALLTKGIAVILLPGVLVALFWAIGRSGRRLLLRRVPLVAALVIALNASHGLREYGLTGSPLGVPFPDVGAHLHFQDDHVSVTGTMSTVLRNLSLHLSTRSDAINARIESVVRGIVGLLGESADSPDNTWLETTYFVGYHLPPAASQRNELFTGNPLHLLLVAVAVVVLVANRKDHAVRPTMAVMAGIAASFVLYCALIRWQIWGARLHLPLFVLASAVVGVVLTPRSSSRLLAATAAVLLLFGLDCAARNGRRPLIARHSNSVLTVPRARQYFADSRTAEATPWIEAAARIRASSCLSVGLDEADGDFVDYPLLAMIGADRLERRVRYVGVSNRSTRLEATKSAPLCAVACLDCAVDSKRAEPYAAVFGPGVSFGNILLFMRAPEKIELSARRD